jgi:hypothetical protein
MEYFKNSDKNSDKKEFDFSPDFYELSVEDSNLELKGSRLDSANLLFARFSQEEIREMMQDARLFIALEQRGYSNYTLELHVLSELDNRIFIKTSAGEILIHLRLKMNDFYLSKHSLNLKMIYIDWLLTQNVKMGKLVGKKKLFEGQEYPGLNVFKEVTRFIHKLSQRIGAHGIFNVPEYFHDAVLFHKSFKFLNPKKEGVFRSLIHQFKNLSLRTISDMVHGHRVFNETKNEVFLWRANEMFYSDVDEISQQIFNQEYYSIVDTYLHRYKFKILGMN